MSAGLITYVSPPFYTLVLTSRLPSNAKFLSVLPFFEVPLVHRTRYARSIVWRLATTATDDDLKWLAVGVRDVSLTEADTSA